MLNTYNISRQNSENLTGEKFDVLQKARQDLVGEIQAIIEYDNHINSTNNEVARKVWSSIRDEELHHVGELLALINYLDPSQYQYVEMGVNEFNEMRTKQ